jgi:predicted dinucleotide-binding enzyme
MKVGIMGTGEVGQTLASAFLALGHEVLMGAREAGNEKAEAWVAQAGTAACEGSFADAARFGEVVVLATLGTAAVEAIEMAGPENLAGTILLDATNPLEFPAGAPPRLAIAGHDSGGERVQAAAPAALVVKCFNTVGSSLMFRPEIADGPPDMFICGNDATAKERVAALLADFGWGAVDIGGIESSRYLEAMCLVWLLHALASSPPTWDHAFKLIRKSAPRRGDGPDFADGSYH